MRDYSKNQEIDLFSEQGVVPTWRQENILRLDDYYCDLSNFALNARLSTQVPLPFWLKRFLQGVGKHQQPFNLYCRLFSQ